MLSMASKCEMHKRQIWPREHPGLSSPVVAKWACPERLNVLVLVSRVTRALIPGNFHQFPKRMHAGPGHPATSGRRGPLTLPLSSLYSHRGLGVSGIGQRSCAAIIFSGFTTDTNSTTVCRRNEGQHATYRFFAYISSVRCLLPEPE